MNAPAIKLHHRFEDDPRRGFSTPAAFLAGVMSEVGARSRDDVVDLRLRSLSARDKDDGRGGELAFLLPEAFAPPSLSAAAGSDEQGVYSDPSGGFAVPPPAVFPGALGAVETDPTAGRTRRFPMEVPTLDIPARADKDHSSSLTGGFQAARRAETVAFPASRGEMELISLRASSLVGLSYATEEILMDSAGSFAAIVASGFRDEMAGVLLAEKIRGTGGDQYLGVLKSPALITVDKESGQAADSIVAANILEMRKRCWRYSNAIWLANYDTLEQLAEAHIVVGTSAGQPLFHFSEREGEADTLAGRPCYFTEHASTLGDVGDLVLAVWSEYLEGVYVPFTGASSVHVRFENHEQVLKFWIRSAGAPWWRAPLTPKNSTTTLSSLVTLAERAA